MGRWSLLAFGLLFACGGQSSATDEASGRGGRGTSGSAGSGANTGGTSGSGNPSGGTNTGGGAGSVVAGAAGTAGVGTVGPLIPPREEEVACTKNSDCVFELQACCFCYNYAVSDLAAVNASYAESYRSRVCEGTSSCGPCGSWPRGVSPNVVATCREGRCAVVDIYDTELTECETKEDCKFRSSRCCGCMESVGSNLIIAIGVDQDAAYEALRCDPDAACAECAATIPEAPDFYQACFSGRCGAATIPD